MYVQLRILLTQDVQVVPTATRPPTDVPDELLAALFDARQRWLSARDQVLQLVNQQAEQRLHALAPIGVSGRSEPSCQNSIG